MINDSVKEKIKSIFESTEDKNEAITEALMLLSSEANQELVESITEEARKAANDAAYLKSLGLHTPTRDEEKFYNILKSGNIRQAITANQADIIPNETIDRTLESVKQASDVLSLVTFAPANIKKWILGSHTGSAQWGELTSALAKEKSLSAAFTTVDFTLGKMWALLVIPKAIRDLALPFVDRYFTEILAEAIQDGWENGYLNGSGITKGEPTGILKTIADPTTAKAVAANVVKLNPRDKGVIAALKTLSTNALLNQVGSRTIPSLHVICNPSDYFEYVRPAMLVQTPQGAWVDGTGLGLTVHQTTNIAAGTAVLTIPGQYLMGSSGVETKTYDQTLALEDADLVIAKVYANGRATDDNVAVPFDVTKLKPFAFPTETTTVTA